MGAPACSCGQTTRLTTGAEIYPRRPELAGKQIYTCDGCGARVGCHPGTTVALGTPADHETRIARMRFHEVRLDPLWQNAWRYYDGKGNLEIRRKRQARRDIGRAARDRVYLFLADRLGISAHDCHTGLFDVERCRAAWRALEGVTYSEIRAWAKAREPQRDEVAA